MNTKYPLNGRAATLADLVHEYGPNSGWPSNKTYGLLALHEDDTQPFQTLIFKSTLDSNNKFQAEIPYEIVYFDDVYSKNQKDNNGKNMRLIQRNDSSVFYDINEESTYGQLSPASYIIANIVSNPTKVKNGYFGFKFIGANIDKQSLNHQQYYYNYKTSDGEATVMYALRNILQILKESSKNNDNQKKHFIDSIFSDYTELKDSDYYKENKPINADVLGNILDNIDKEFSSWQLDTDAYKYLGDAIWTSKHIYYKNYTSEKDRTDKEQEQNIVKKARAAKYFTNAIVKFNNLNNTIYTILDINTKQKNNYYSYNSMPDDSLYRRLLYFFDLFLNSQRFFISFVTSFRFSKISNYSYLQKDPVLRCDLGVMQLYEYIIIQNAVHDWQTALPAGEITYNTSINIIIQYKVKYKNLTQFSNIITTTLGPITFDDIRKYRTPTVTDTNGNDVENDIWYALKTYPKNSSALPIEIDPNLHGNSITPGLYSTNTILYGSSFFPALPHKDFENNNDYNISKVNYSLGILKWPNGENLVLTSLDDVKSSMNNPNFINPITNQKNYADTSDEELFGENNPNDIIKTGGIAPFGVLRIHTSLDTSDENKYGSSIYFDIKLYRCKNYYYISTENTDSDDANVYAYFMPKYTDTTPYISLPIIKLKNNETTDNSINNVINELNKKFNDGYIYSIPSHTIITYFTIQSGTAKTIIYASGRTETQNNLGSNTYTNKNQITFYYYVEDDNEWVQVTGDYININSNPSGNNISKQYEITFNLSQNYHQYWRFTLNNINQYYYFRCNYYYKPNDNTSFINMTIHHLFVSDESLIQGMIEYQLGMRTQQDKSTNQISLKYAVYNTITDIRNDNENPDKKSSLSIIEHAINNAEQQNVVISVEKAIYIEPIAFKSTERYVSEKFYGNIYSPFHVAYETKSFDGISEFNIQKQIYGYNFNSCALFDKTSNSRIEIEKLYKKESVNVYLAFEPIYIINNGNVFKDSNAKAEDIINEYSTYFNTCSITNIKLSNNGSEQVIKKPSGDSNNNFIKSVFSKSVYIDTTSICISVTSTKTEPISSLIYDTTDGLIKTYLFDFDIKYYKYKNNTEKFEEANSVNVTNKIQLMQLDNTLRNIQLDGDEQYLINIVLKKFKKRLQHFTITVSSDVPALNGSCQIQIKSLPNEYEEGIIAENDTYQNTIQVPENTQIHVKNTYNWDEYKTYKFHGFSVNSVDKGKEFDLTVTTDIQIYMFIEYPGGNSGGNTDSSSTPGDVTITEESNKNGEIILTLSISSSDQNTLIRYVTSTSNVDLTPTLSNTSIYSDQQKLKFNNDITIAACGFNASNNKWGPKSQKHFKLQE